MSIWNPIALSLSSGLGSSQVAESMTIQQAWSISLKGVCSWEGEKNGPNTSWFSYCVHKEPRKFLLPYKWLA
jgi:hypothetical protein